MARAVIAFLTDFGLRDHYVGTMKGVAAGICPDATLIDITHDVPAQDIVAGAYELAAAVPYFPLETVFVGVVDPGVGGTRRGIAAEIDRRRFVGPDNGLFTVIVRQAGSIRAVELTEPRFQRLGPSRTFEGRDRFAPAAAWLATGVPLDHLGPAIAEVTQLEMPTPVLHGHTLVGSVVRVDRFGNLITNIDLPSLAPLQGVLIVRAGDREMDRLVHTYGDVPLGSVCALIGSSGCLEVAVNGGSAAAALRLDRGAVVQVRARTGA